MSFEFRPQTLCQECNRCGRFTVVDQRSGYCEQCARYVDNITQWEIAHPEDQQ